MMNLSGKKVLYIATKFFGYELEIQTELEKRGACIDYIADRPLVKPWQQALNKIFPLLLQPYIEHLFRKELQKISASHYDLIFVVRGQTLSVKMHKLLRQKYPHAKKVLYMWDSMENSPSVAKTLSFYDKKSSFDPQSAKQYGMEFRPLFFINKFSISDNKKNLYGISFIGTMHSDRYGFIKSIENELTKDVSHYWYFYLQAKWVFYLYKLTKLAMRNAKIMEFQFSPILKKDVSEIFLKSKCILDVEHPRQNGLTMRTFEAIGAAKKIITTNKNIKNYDFYNENNILVVDRKKPIIPPNFFASDYINIADNLYYKYSISGWLDDILL